MKNLAELEQRILSELEEAGEESVQVLAVTVLDNDGSTAELEQFKGALLRLVQSDCARVSNVIDSSRKPISLSVNQSLEVINGIGEFLKFDDARKRWIDCRRTGPPFGPEYPYIVNTDVGKKLGFEILDQRGYQWWRSSKE